MKKVLDPGHFYELLTLDQKGVPWVQQLRFVKRCDLFQPERYPGNYCAYPGTTLQSVLRCLCERVRYLQNQISCPENVLVLFFLRAAIWLLEFRAARRHKRSYFRGLNFAEQAPMCPDCGHTGCKHRPPV